MIRKIKVEGYQSLKSAEIELGKFTVILGESNVGKSALLRSVKAVVENQTGLDDFLTVGMKSCRVELTLQRGEEMIGVIWEKTKKGTQYTIHTKEASEKLGKGVGVPVEVQNALRMERIDFAQGIRYTPNFHDQFSTPFLLEESGSRVAKMLGEMSGVNLLYRAIAEANVRAKRNGQKANDQATSLEKLSAKLKEYEFIRVKGPKLQEAKQLLAGVEGDAKALSRMQQVYSDWAMWQQASDKAHVLQSSLAPILTIPVPLEEATVGLNDTRIMRDRLVAWLKAAVYARDCGIAKEKISKLKGVVWEPIEEAAEHVFLMRKARDSWAEAGASQAVARGYVLSQTNEVVQTKGRLDILVTKLKVCPFCGHMMHKEGETCACCK